MFDAQIAIINRKKKAVAAADDSTSVKNKNILSLPLETLTMKRLTRKIVVDHHHPAAGGGP